MKIRQLTLLMTIFSGVLLVACTKNSSDLDQRAEKILSQMTLEEKVGQMTQITLDVVGNGESVYSSGIPFAFNEQRLEKALLKYHVGSILNTTNNYALTPEQWHKVIGEIQDVATQKSRLKIPVIYGIDAIHGVTYTAGATLFPQQITTAATFSPVHAYNLAYVTAYETRASGIPWNFSPVLDLGADPRFSRQFEGFGEDPYLASVFGEQMILGYEGIQDSISSGTKVASCMKHFLGYSVPTSGKDRTPAFIPENVLREYHLASFKKAIDAGSESLMVNSGIINGISVHANHDLITKLLKEELGFQGVVVSDWMDIINLYKRDRIAADHKEAIKIAVNAGVDMSMVPYAYEEFCDNLVALVKEGEVKESRIDDAVRRILKLKLKLGLFEKPITNYKDYPDFASEKFSKLAYNAAAEAITLLKNQDNILPLSKNTKVLVTGPNANSMRSLNGAWTYSWQGEKVERFATKYNTILEAITNEAGAQNVKYVPGVSYDETSNYFVEKENQFAQAIQAAKSVDVVILCLGENSYAEKPGDLNDLTISPLQRKLAEAIAATGKPVVLVLNEGRPRCIREFEPLMKAVVQTFLPGNYGGDALADILYGDINPSGRLPYNYPSYPNSIVNYYHKPAEEQMGSAGAYKYESDYNPQWEFGHGLSYTTFTYSNLKVSKDVFGKNENVQISVDIKNTGKMAGKESVLLFTSDLIASVTPDVKRLRRFEKIYLQPGESKTVQFEISDKDLSFMNFKNEWTIEPGEFEIAAGTLKTKIRYQ